MPFVKTRLTSWSMSRYATYKQCPRKAKLQYLDKLPTNEEKLPALVRGAALHDAAEAYLKDVKRAVPKDLAPIALLLKDLKKRVKAAPRERVVLEDQLAFTEDWAPTRWDDWARCWVRIKVDLALLTVEGDAVVAELTDWKSGKYRSDNREDYLEQLELYAVALLTRWGAAHPTLRVRPRLVYTDHNLIYPSAEAGASEIEYALKDLAPLRKTWAKRVRPMLNDQKFAPKPNQFCKWCPYGVSKGGPCRYG